MLFLAVCAVCSAVACPVVVLGVRVFASARIFSESPPQSSCHHVNIVNQYIQDWCREDVVT
jgi:hypothetical protein